MGFADRDNTLAIGFCMPIVSLPLIVARFYFHYKRESLRADDWLCIPAWLFLTGSCAALITGVYKRSFATTDTGSQDTTALAAVTATIPFCWLFANGFTKLSILFFYKRVFVGRRFHVISWILVGATIFWIVFSFIADMLFCGTHIHNKFYGPWDICPSYGAYLQIPVYIGDSLVDFALIIFPIPYILKLRLSRMRKLSLIFTFVVGNLAFVVGLVLLVFSMLLLTRPGVFTNAAFDTAVFSLPEIEVGLGLIACNLPTLGLVSWRLLRQYVTNTWSRLRFLLRSNSRQEQLRSSATTTIIPPPAPHDEPAWQTPTTTLQEYDKRFVVEGYEDIDRNKHKEWHTV